MLLKQRISNLAQLTLVNIWFESHVLSLKTSIMLDKTEEITEFVVEQTLRSYQV